MARRPKRSPEREQAILAALRAGNTRGAAAGAGGIDPATFYRWLASDATFRENVEKAEADAERMYLAHVQKAAVESWQAAAWWLERRRSQEYARHDRVDLRVQLEREVQRVASEQGIEAADVWAELRELGIPVPS